VCNEGTGLSNPPSLAKLSVVCSALANCTDTHEVAGWVLSHASYSTRMLESRMAFFATPAKENTGA